MLNDFNMSKYYIDKDPTTTDGTSPYLGDILTLANLANFSNELVPLLGDHGWGTSSDWTGCLYQLPTSLQPSGEYLQRVKGCS